MCERCPGEIKLEDMKRKWQCKGTCC
jgi:hypothetical protein